MENIHDNAQQHPLLNSVASISTEFDKATTFNPTFLPTADKATALHQLSRVVTRAQGLLLSVMAASADVADEHGAERVGDWYAATTRHDHRPALGLDHLARSLDQTFVHLQAAVMDGRVNLDQALVITHALDDLPNEVPAEIHERAELHLIALADDFAPTPLRRLARKGLDVIAPEISDEAERTALDREEQRATERTRLSLTPLGDGTTRITGRIPDVAAGRLRTYLEAFASPRRTAADTDGERIPTPRLLDLGRTRRLHTAAQRKAIRIQHHQCQSDGCTVPAPWCETHHPHAWSAGGKTDLDNAALLCCHHHHRAHDTRYLTQQLPNGDYRFTRRT